MGIRSAITAALFAGALAAIAASGPADVNAGHLGLAFPAPAGSDWTIAAGYNTATHIDEDPYAIDVVRVDEPTAGTPVLAPIAGRVGFVSDRCLTIEDSHGQEILLCHLFPTSGLHRGGLVAQGQALGTVAPSGQAGNNGLAHIHLAVHRSLGNGLIQETLPLADDYAVEGQDLPPTPSPNAYAGVTFHSTNMLVGTASETGPAAGDLDGDTATNPSTASYIPRILLPGWNIVGWGAPVAVSDAVAIIADQVGVVFAFDRESQTFRRYAPGALPAANTLIELERDAAVLIFITAPTAVTWLTPPVDASLPAALIAGFNLVTWMGESRPVAEAISSLGDSLIAVYALDADSQQYRVFRPDGPALINDLKTIEPGQGVWVQLREPAEWIVPAPLPQGDVQQWRVLGPGCLNLRPAPTIVNAPPITCLTEGTAVVVLGESATDTDGREWIRVAVDELTGWVAAEFIATFEVGRRVEGEATYYYPGLAGNPMYCGGTYDRFDPTIAATTSWPCGTKLRVWRGNQFVDVTVQDTGLLPANHVDLSEAAFQRIGTLSEGRLQVEIEVLD